MTVKNKRVKNKKVNKMTSIELVEKRRCLKNNPSLHRKHIEDRLFALIGCIPTK